MGYEHDSRLSAKGLIPSQDGERMARSYFTDLKRSQVLSLYFTSAIEETENEMENELDLRYGKLLKYYLRVKTILRSTLKSWKLFDR